MDNSLSNDEIKGTVYEFFTSQVHVGVGSFMVFIKGRRAGSLVVTLSFFHLSELGNSNRIEILCFVPFIKTNLHDF